MGTPPATPATTAIIALNAAGPDEGRSRLSELCGAPAWVERVLGARPFADLAALQDAADSAFDALGEDDWRAAFAAHARIGQPKRGDEQGRSEQAAAAAADSAQRQALADGNAAYESRFGHVFLIRAKGRSAAEVLAALGERLENSAAEELAIAAGQQREITRLRIEELR